MTSRVLTRVLTAGAAITLALIVLSFAVRSEPACIRTYPGRGIPEDMAFSEWSGALLIDQPRPSVDGLLIRYRSSPDGTRSYAQAHRGYLVFSRFVPLNPDTPRASRKVCIAGLTIEQDSTSGIPALCSSSWHSLNDEAIQWMRKSYATVHAVRVPLLPAFVILGIYPTVGFVRGPVRRWRWRRKGRCDSCGYDLTGNTSGTCPECGTTMGTATQSSAGTARPTGLTQRRDARGT